MAVGGKHCIFLSSTGRTGTKFFGETMSAMIDDCISVHEPDTTRVSKPGDWIRKMARFGAPKMLWGQYRERYSLGKLTTTRHRGLTSEKKAVGYVADNRLEYIESFSRGLYIESNHIIYGVLDLLTDVFPSSKVIWVMRDPRSWIRSAINSTAYHLYGIWDWDSLNLSVRAYNFPDDPSAAHWKKMSKFEKFCWYYANVNNRAFELMEKIPDCRVFRFEDLFNPELRDRCFTGMLDYASNFSDGFSRNYTYRPELLERRIHAAASKRQLPGWTEWNSGMAAAMDYHCGKLMKRFGYGEEQQWQDKIGRSGSFRYRA